MNKQLDRKIEQLERGKAKELEKVEKIQEIIDDYDSQIKQLLAFKKEQEKIIKQQEELTNKVKEVIGDKK